MSEADNPTIEEDRKMRYAWFAELIRSVGVPTVVLAAVMWALYQFSMWFGDKVALPLMKQNISTMENIDKSQREITQTLQSLQKDIDHYPEKNHVLLTEIAKNNMDRDQQQKKVVELLERINTSIKSQER